jgi:hypothetical protein
VVPPSAPRPAITETGRDGFDQSAKIDLGGNCDGRVPRQFEMNLGTGGLSGAKLTKSL